MSGEQGRRWLAAMNEVVAKHLELGERASERRRARDDYLARSRAAGKLREEHAHDEAAAHLEQRAIDAERAVGSFEAAVGARTKLSVAQLNALLAAWEPGPGPEAARNERGDWLLGEAAVMISVLLRGDDTAESVPGVVLRAAALVNEYARAQPKRVVRDWRPLSHDQRGAERVLAAVRAPCVQDVLRAGSVVSRGKTIQKRGVPAACAVVLHQLGVELNPETIHQKIRSRSKS